MTVATIRGGMLAALALGLAACGSPKKEEAANGSAPAESAAPAQAGADTATASGPAAPTAFAMCSSCHSAERGRNGVGPSLAGVYGTKAAEVPGYAFSDALKQSGLTWDDATLDKWLTSPMTLVPGTRMTFAGVSDPAKRQELIAYLKAIK